MLRENHDQNDTPSNIDTPLNQEQVPQGGTEINLTESSKQDGAVDGR